MDEMRRQIMQMRADLDRLGEPDALPEMIEATNVIRANEHLEKTNLKKSEILDAYSEYTARLEKLVSYMFEIQDDLKEILQDQSSLIRDSARKKKRAKK